MVMLLSTKLVFIIDDNMDIIVRFAAAFKLPIGRIVTDIKIGLSVKK
jgi:hypothetical protein